MNKKNSEKDNIRTILTKAVCARGIQLCQSTIYIHPEEDIELKQVLGCFIADTIITKSECENFCSENIDIIVEGEFKVHIWYGTNEDTRISKGSAKFSEIISVENLEGTIYHKKEDLNKNISTWINKKPVCVGSMVVNKNGTSTVAIQVEHELGVEVVGEAKINIRSYKPAKAKKYEENILSSDITFFDELFNSNGDFEVDEISYDE